MPPQNQIRKLSRRLRWTTQAVGYKFKRGHGVPAPALNPTSTYEQLMATLAAKGISNFEIESLARLLQFEKFAVQLEVNALMAKLQDMKHEKRRK